MLSCLKLAVLVACLARPGSGASVLRGEHSLLSASSRASSSRSRGDGPGAGGGPFYDQVLDALPAINDHNMGVTMAHYQTLQQFANEKMVALFIRISDKTSLRLIQDGNFACKSVDVHDKSSTGVHNGGTVPVDPFFNKKLGGTGDGPSMAKPKPNILEQRASDIAHAAEETRSCPPVPEPGYQPNPLLSARRSLMNTSRTTCCFPVARTTVLQEQRRRPAHAAMMRATMPHRP